MISYVLALMLAAGPASADKLALARREYSHCLKAFMDQSVKDKMTKEAFATALPTACSDKLQTFRTYSISSDTAVGIKRAVAEENAASEVQDLMANTKELFTDYTTPEPAPN
ncbi:MAG: hypothetical protein E6G94_16090 [Alphaproteobacteria bacterium]|nr:MAG: hypothetical protein E6G94_16090 [Alphaproteobacteria bacterium]